MNTKKHDKKNPSQMTNPKFKLSTDNADVCLTVIVKGIDATQNSIILLIIPAGTNFWSKLSRILKIKLFGSKTNPVCLTWRL